jgi:hypothetical protein
MHTVISRCIHVPLTAHEGFGRQRERPDFGAFCCCRRRSCTGSRYILGFVCHSRVPCLWTRYAIRSGGACL